MGLQAKYEAEVMLGGGRTLKRGLALGEVEVEGVKRLILIAIGGDEETPIIGYTTLEVLGFKVNPLTGRLERTQQQSFKSGRTLKHSFRFVKVITV
jgi:predicted aspartyl protease